MNTYDVMSRLQAGAAIVVGCRAFRWIAPAIVAVYVVLAGAYDFVDTGVYVAGGKAVLRGEPLYDLRVAPIGLPFTYPPFAALVFALLTAAPVRIVQVLWTMGSLYLLYFTVRQSVERFGGWRWEGTTRLIWPLVLLAEPVRNNIGLGQINFLLAFLVLWDLSRPDGARFQGAAIGVAAALKLTPLFFIVHLAVTRPMSAARNAIVSFVAAGTLAFAILTRDSVRFWCGFFLDAQRVGGIGYISNQSLFAFVLRLARDPRATQLVWYAVTTALILAFLAFARHIRRSAPHTVVVIDAVACTMPLVCSPVSWTHHWILAMPLVLVGVRLGLQQGSRPLVWAAFAMVVSMMAGLVWLAPHEAEREFHLRPFEFLVGHSYLLTAMATACITMRMILSSQNLTSCTTTSPPKGL